MDTYYFYKITNDIDNDVYIGSTKDPVQRWYKHKSSTKLLTKSCVINYKMSDIGVEHFSFHIIETQEFNDKQKALEREDELMCEYNSINKQCASTKQKVINKKVYDKQYNSQPKVKRKHREYKDNNRDKILEQAKEYNNRPEVKQRKAEWAKKKHAETYVKGCPMQKAKTKAYYDANKEKKQQYHYNRWELKTFMTRKHFSFDLYN
eukprot:SAG11_NODE_5886_length_1440_cov_111.859060_3_plen_206_part_00